MASAAAPAPVPTIGVLALQGAFIEHLAKFLELGVACREVRTAEELAGCCALVVPGGESTAMGLLAARQGLLEPLRAWSQARKPYWGTCAGMIMLADRAEGQKEGGQALVGGLDVTVSRNYFGSQLASFEAPLQLAAGPCPPHDLAAAGITPASGGVFIRAPAILACGPGVQPLAYVAMRRRSAQVPAASPEADAAAAAAAAAAPAPVCVAAATDAFLVTAFHPELAPGCLGWHRLFVQMAERQTGLRLLPAGGGGGGGGGSGGSSSNAPLPVGFDADRVTSGNVGTYDISRRVVTGENTWASSSR